MFFEYPTCNFRTTRLNIVGVVAVVVYPLVIIHMPAKNNYCQNEPDQIRDDALRDAYAALFRDAALADVIGSQDIPLEFERLL